MKSAPSSLEINRNVRRVLVSNWVDLGRLSLHSVKQSVYIRGSMRKLPGSDSDLTPQNLEAMHNKIRRLNGVKHIHMELDNWTRSPVTGAWERVGSKEKREAAQHLSDREGADREDIGG